MINDTSLVGWRTVLAQVLNAPVAELAVGNQINVDDNFLDGGALVVTSAKFRI